MMMEVRIYVEAGVRKTVAIEMTRAEVAVARKSLMGPALHAPTLDAAGARIALDVAMGRAKNAAAFAAVLNAATRS